MKANPENSSRYSWWKCGWEGDGPVFAGYAGGAGRLKMKTPVFSPHLTVSTSKSVSATSLLPVRLHGELILSQACTVGTAFSSWLAGRWGGTSTKTDESRRLSQVLWSSKWGSNTRCCQKSWFRVRRWLLSFRYLSKSVCCVNTQAKTVNSQLSWMRVGFIWSHRQEHLLGVFVLHS